MSMERTQSDHLPILQSPHPNVLPLPLSMLYTKVALEPSELPKESI